MLCNLNITFSILGAPPIATCDIGKPLPNVFCGRGPNRQDCPSGYFCKIDPVDRFAICCKTSEY